MSLPAVSRFADQLAVAASMHCWLVPVVASAMLSSVWSRVTMTERRPSVISWTPSSLRSVKWVLKVALDAAKKFIM